MVLAFQVLQARHAVVLQLQVHPLHQPEVEMGATLEMELLASQHIALLKFRVEEAGQALWTAQFA